MHFGFIVNSVGRKTITITLGAYFKLREKHNLKQNEAHSARVLILSGGKKTSNCAERQSCQNYTLCVYSWNLTGNSKVGFGMNEIRKRDRHSNGDVEECTRVGDETPRRLEGRETSYKGWMYLLGERRGLSSVFGERVKSEKGWTQQPVLLGVLQRETKPLICWM